MSREEVDFSLFDEIRPLVVALDPAGAIARWNTACSRLTGYSLDEVRGKRVWDFLIPAEEVDAVHGVFTSLRGGEFPSSFVNDWVTKAGLRRTIRWTNTCIVDDAGGVLFVLSTGTAVSDRPRIAAPESSVQPVAFRLNSSFPMWVFDRGTLRFLAVNDAAVARYGYSRDEFLSMTIREVRTPDEVLSLHEALTHLDEGVRWLTPVKHRTKAGDVLRVEIALTPVEFHGRSAAMVLVGAATGE